MPENRNDFEEEMEELEDWQENQYNIGRYYDPNQRPNLFKFLQGMPLLFLVLGIACLGLAVFLGVVSEISFATIVHIGFLVFLGAAFIIGGKQRLERCKKDRTE